MVYHRATFIFGERNEPVNRSRNLDSFGTDSVCAGFLYLMVTTPVDSDEDQEEADLRVRNSMRETL